MGLAGYLKFMSSPSTVIITAVLLAAGFLYTVRLAARLWCSTCTTVQLCGLSRRLLRKSRYSFEGGRTCAHLQAEGARLTAVSEP